MLTASTRDQELFADGLTTVAPATSQGVNLLHPSWKKLSARPFGLKMWNWSRRYAIGAAPNFQNIWHLGGPVLRLEI